MLYVLSGIIAFVLGFHVMLPAIDAFIDWIFDRNEKK